ncbi:MAG TPA: PIN domain-containing protein [Pyrinomonadaceae bacterium]|nr:PIN domain-containing protein [Pyrinomonadaceae bacterium]
MLLDTSGLMCLFDQRDNRHALATKQYQSATRRLIHNYVFAEFVALVIARRAPLADALRFTQSIHHSGEVEVVWVDGGLHERAMRLLAEREDKRWTLCDAVSFILMGASRIAEALTTDHDFEQAGFVRLLDR